MFLVWFEGLVLKKMSGFGLSLVSCIGSWNQVKWELVSVSVNV